jgi:quinol monooxygenase YgiN
MEQPIVFVTTHRIKDGKLEQFKQQNRSVAARIEETKPNTLAFLAYLNEEQTEVSIVHVFPDAEAMDEHMKGLSERASAAAEVLEFGKLEVLGTPSDAVAAQMDSASQAGVTVRMAPHHISGYLRLDQD